MDIRINQIKHWIASLHTNQHTQARWTPALVAVNSRGGHTATSYFWADTFTKQAGGFFHIETESTQTAVKKAHYGRKKYNPGKILIFPFVFLLIILDEFAKMFSSGKEVVKTPDEASENRYNPK